MIIWHLLDGFFKEQFFFVTKIPHTVPLKPPNTHNIIANNMAYIVAINVLIKIKDLK